MGAGDGNGPLPKPDNVTNPCGEGPTRHARHNFDPKPPHDGAGRSQVNDPASYAIAGKLLLATAGAFAGVLLALVALHLYNSSRRRRLGGGQRRLLRSLAIVGGGEDRGGGAAPSPRGLDPAVLAAIPVVVVDAGAGAVGGDCAVCLAEFEPGEKARALPRCGHRFHVECIDAWFRGNATCPLCRADVFVAPPAAAPSAPAEDGGARPDVRIDVDGDAAANASVAPAMARLPSGTDLGKARQVFASTRFAASF